MADPSADVRPGATPTRAPEGPGLDEPRRSAARESRGRRFRFVAGEWMDEAYDPGARLPEVRVTAARERAALELRVPELAAFATLGRRAVVVVGGTVYVFDIRD